MRKKFYKVCIKPFSKYVKKKHEYEYIIDIYTFIGATFLHFLFTENNK